MPAVAGHIAQDSNPTGMTSTETGGIAGLPLHGAPRQGRGTLGSGIGAAAPDCSTVRSITTLGKYEEWRVRSVRDVT